jgi:thiaminase/transcriptional activator TenA
LAERCAERLEASAAHPLLRAMADGDVTPDMFARYLVREGAFVRTAARLTGYLVWRAPDWPTATQHAHALAGLVGEQSNYFADATGDASIATLTDRPGPLDHQLATAIEQGGYPAVVTCFAAAETLYAGWCAAAVSRPGTRRASDVDRWIRLHTEPAFMASVALLQHRVDAIPVDDADDEQLDRWFVGMLDAEDAFHNLPLEPAGD